MHKALAALALLMTLTAAHAQTPTTLVLPLDKVQTQADLDRTIRALDAAVFNARL